MAELLFFFFMWGLACVLGTEFYLTCRDIRKYIRNMMKEAEGE